MVDNKLESELERWPAVLRLSCAWTLGIVTVTLMPLEVSALMLRLSWSESTASSVAGSQLLGIVVSCLLMPRWLHRLSPGRLTAMVLGLVAAQWGSAVLTGMAELVVLRWVVGVVEGVGIVLVGACLARHANAQLLWGKVIFLSGVLSAGMLTLMAFAPSSLKATGVWLGLGVVEIVLGLAVLPLLQWVRTQRSPTQRARPSVSTTIWMVWGLQCVIYMVQSGQWAVAGLHGEQQGMSTPQVGMALAVSSLLGFGGCVLTSLEALRRQHTLMLLSAIGTMAAAVIWFFGSQGLTNFFASQLVLNVAFNGITPLLNALLTQRDTDGSLLGRSVVLSFAAAAVGTMGAGELLSSGGAAQFSHVAGLLLLLSLPLGAVLMRQSRPLQ